MTFFIENNMAFQIGQSTDHAILELADQMANLSLIKSMTLLIKNFPH